MHGRVAMFGPQSCPDGRTQAYQTLTRITFTAADGTEFELRDQATGGAPATVTPCAGSGQSRGTIFITADGTTATFISDTTIIDYIDLPDGGNDLFYPSGFLLMRDGTRYRFDNGVVSWLRDRNGNRISFTYDPSRRALTITDSLNRQISVSYRTETIPFDEIVFKGFGGQTRTMRVNYAAMGSALRSGYSLQTYQQLFPELNGSFSGQYNPSVITSVTLPNNKQFEFKYNPYGELARVVLPTGGATEYDYAAGVTDGYPSGVTPGGDYGFAVYRRVIERRIYVTGGSGNSFDHKMTYSRPETSMTNVGYVTTEQLSNAGAVLSRSKHYFHGSPRLSFALEPVSYPAWKDGREYQTEALDTSGATVLRRSVNEFAQRAPVSWWTGGAAYEPPNDTRLIETVTTLEPSGANLVSKQTFGFDDSVPYNNQNNVKEFDFGVSAPGGLVRETRTTFATASSYTNTAVHLRSLPLQVSIHDGSGTERARSLIEYDNYSTQTHHAGLLDRTNISGLDPTFGTTYTTRGNATGTTNYLLVNGTVTGSISSFSQYDIAGNVVKMIDARGNSSMFEYDDCFGAPDGNARLNSAPLELSSVGKVTFAFLTKVTNSLGHTVYGQFDYYLGKPVDGEDANGVVTSGFYNDPLDRPKQIHRAVGVLQIQNQTTFNYDDVARSITTSNDLNNFSDNAVVSKAFYDGLGRTIETREYEGGTNYIATQTQYDALGRPFKTSTPYRPWQSESAIWTTTTYDDLGRVLTVTTPDNAMVKTAYSGNRVLVADQNSSDDLRRKRISETDALGRLKTVWEVTAADALTESITFPDWPSVTAGYRTSYAYDVLDNLNTVTQGAQTRTFVYDSLKRLTSATNPESGTISYQYDSNGNLTLKTDARSISITYAYDALNRNTTVDYSNTTVNPDITRIYDTATNGKGRLRESYAGGTDTTGTIVDHTKIMTYDVLGRPLDQRQRFKSGGTWSGEYQIQRGYNLAGGITSQTYPSGRTVGYTYDSAGRSSSFTGNLGDGTNRTYSTGIIYSSLGGMTKEEFGTTTPLFNKSFYNSRGQLSEIRVGTGPTDSSWNRGAIINHYSNSCWGFCGGTNSTTAMTDNNGNLKKQEVYVPLIDQPQPTSYTTWWQGFDYDNLNRLQRAHEYTGDPAKDWQQEFVYDRWGNRTIHQTNTWGLGINKKEFTVQTVNGVIVNQLGVPAGQPGTMTYDAAGNLTTDTYTGAGDRVYNAENRMTKAWGGNNQWQEYTYNADGQRTRRKLDGVETWQIYGMDGELLAEYAASGAAASPQKEYGYRNGQLLVTATPATGQRVNHALATNGGFATASSSFSLGFTANATTNGDRKGLHWGSGPLTGSGWVDASSGSFPDWLQIDFNGSKTIDEVDVVTVQDDYLNPVEPTETMTFNTYGLTAYDVQYWNGSTWVTVTGGSVTGNNKIWRRLTFAAITTSKVRVLTNAAADNGNSRMVEVEAWGTVGGGPSEVNWLVTDQLGTPRMVFDKTGSFASTKRHDYLPFGEELLAGTGNRTPQQGYVADNVRQKFTSKERDNETGLDYFGARYFASTQGQLIRRSGMLTLFLCLAIA